MKKIKIKKGIKIENNNNNGLGPTNNEKQKKID